MRGMAQQLYRPTQTPHHWPILHTLLEKKYLDYSDFALTETLFKDSEQEFAALVSFLALCTRNGHLCIKVTPSAVIPEVKQTCLEVCEEISDELSVELLESYQKLIIKGAQLDINRNEIVREGDLFYFQRYWQCEREIFQQLTRIKNSPSLFQIDQKSVETHVSNLLLPEQIKAVLGALQNPMTIITGGPGTGKTYTASFFLKILWDSLPTSQREQFKIALAAPTGKAASNLQKSLQTTLPVQVKTLHALLGIRGNKKRSTNMLKEDFVLVDESSMIDAELMRDLLQAIKPGARLILLGDRHQLPPVGMGMVFGELDCPTYELTTCMRAELKSLVSFASAIKQGNPEQVFAHMESGQIGISRLSHLSPQSLISYCETLFAAASHHINDPLQLLKAFNAFRVLSPLRQGPLGFEQLNERFYYQLKTDTEPFAVPIIIVQNDHKRHLFNGESGVLMRHHNPEQDYALFWDAHVADTVRTIPAILLPRYEYAYVLSIHKSQGSEFDRVLVVMPPRSEKFGREGLYTAVTRAKKQVEIMADDETLHLTIKRQNCRLSIGKQCV